MKIPVAKDCYVLRFLLPDENSVLGANICQHIFLEKSNQDNKIIRKPYQIVSLDNDKGIVDIMIKVYNQKNKDTDFGYFSNFLANLEVNKNIFL